MFILSVRGEESNPCSTKSEPEMGLKKTYIKKNKETITKNGHIQAELTIYRKAGPIRADFIVCRMKDYLFQCNHLSLTIQIK